MNTERELLLIACFEALERGESVEPILADFPDDAPAVRAMLQLEAALPPLALAPAPAAQAASRRAFLNAAHTMRERKQRRVFPFWLSRALVAGVLVVLLMTSVGAFAQQALPGQPLYPIKRATESLQLGLADDTARAELEAQFAQRRRDEAATLMVQDDRVEVAFDGVVEDQQGERWQVGGVAVLITSDTELSGPATRGATVRVRGTTGANGVQASSIEVVALAAPTARPTLVPLPTATGQPANTPRPTQTPRPAQTATPSPVAATATPQPAATLRPTVAPTVQLLPTARPTLAPTPDVFPPQQPAPTDDHGGRGGSDDSGGSGGGSDDSGGSGGGSDDNSGPGGGGSDDNSGSGGGSDDSGGSGGGGSDDNSGSGGGSDDNSGPGGGGSDDSGGSGGGGSDDSGGSGGGSDDSGGSGGGSDDSGGRGGRGGDDD